ncbi:MAG: hypothetical protein KF773_37330 [Deltaproteobacteria bacterium]|nr:hypothetical protein [Deltaproteobacteria bacterium]
MGERQELPVARIHARGAGQRFAIAGREAADRVADRAARAGRAFGRGGLLVGKALGAVAIPAAVIAVLGLGTAHEHRAPRTPDFKLHIPQVKFDDAAFRQSLITDAMRREAWQLSAEIRRQVDAAMKTLPRVVAPRPTGPRR